MVVLFLILTQGVFAIPPTITRDLPPSAAPSSIFTVTLVMDVDEGDVPVICGLRENYPPGWTVSDISLGGSDKGDRIEWLFWQMGNPVIDQNITYKITVPGGASGTATFSGTADISTVDPYAIVGDTEVTITETTTTTTLAGTTTTTAPTTTTTTPGTTTTTTTIPATTTTSTTVPGTTTTSTTLPVTTTTTTTLPCELPGDYPTCGEVTLEEVIDFILIWSQYQAALEDVINLINAWAESPVCNLPGNYPPCGEVTLEEVIEFILLWSQDQASLEDVINLINAWAE